MTRRTPESYVLAAVGEYLTLKGIWWMRCQSGSHVLEGANGKRRVFRAGRRGMADLLAIRHFEVCSGCRKLFEPIFLSPTRSTGHSRCCGRSGDDEFRPVWLELKSATGRQSEWQKSFQAEVEAEGHTYLLVRDVREVAEFLRRA